MANNDTAWQLAIIEMMYAVAAKLPPTIRRMVTSTIHWYENSVYDLGGKCAATSSGTERPARG